MIRLAPGRQPTVTSGKRKVKYFTLHSDTNSGSNPIGHQIETTWTWIVADRAGVTKSREVHAW